MTDHVYASPTPRSTPAAATMILARPGDRWERDAHQAAHEAMKPAASSGRASVQPLSGSQDGEATAAPLSVSGVLGGRGTPLEPSVRQRFEPRFGHDFSRVRVHTGAAAAQSASEIGARAYTVGPNIVFGSGQYAPGTPAGRQVLAHELAHVVQQDGAQRQRVARLQRLKFSDVLEFGAELSGVPALSEVVHAESQVIDDFVASVRESPTHVMEFFEDEVWEQIKANWPQIIAVTVGLMAAEGAVAFLGAIPEPTLLTKVVAVILQIVILAILGYFAAVELKGVYEEGSRWLTLVGQANGQAQKISEASRAFVRMVWHIILAVLLVAGVRARIRGIAGSGEAAGAGQGGGSGTGGAGTEGGDVTPISSHPRYQPRFQSQAEPPPMRSSPSAFGPGGTARQLAPAEAPLPRSAPDLPPAPRLRPAPASAASKVGSGIQIVPAVVAGVSSGTRQQPRSAQSTSTPKAQPAPQPQTGPAKRHPKQKDSCTNERYDELRDKITKCKSMSFSCSDSVERAALGITTRKEFEKPGAPRWPREEILRRLALAEECAKARDDFQRECFEEAPHDPEWKDHEQQRRDWKTAAKLCREKAQARGYRP